ncbi:hypothetical protein K2X05_13765 [bacterium]|nr:hypothetical protein [bacterium]
MNENQDRKVLPFKPKNNASLLKKNETMATDLKGVAAGTMAFLLVLVVSFNFSIFQQGSEIKKQQKIQRSLASLSTKNQVPVDVKKSLENLNKEMITQIAKRPTATDDLAFGALAGKYSIVSDNGRIREIKVSDSSQATLVRDRFEFIESNADALAPGLNSIRKVSVQKNSEGKKEVYEVQTPAGEAKFKFLIGNENQLLSLVVE